MWSIICASNRQKRVDAIRADFPGAKTSSPRAPRKVWLSAEILRPLMHSIAMVEAGGGAALSPPG